MTHIRGFELKIKITRRTRIAKIFVRTFVKTMLLKGMHCTSQYRSLCSVISWALPGLAATASVENFVKMTILFQLNLANIYLLLLTFHPLLRCEQHIEFNQDVAIFLCLKSLGCKISDDVMAWRHFVYCWPLSGFRRENSRGYNWIFTSSVAVELMALKHQAVSINLNTFGIVIDIHIAI